MELDPITSTSIKSIWLSTINWLEQLTVIDCDQLASTISQVSNVQQPTGWHQLDININNLRSRNDRPVSTRPINRLSLASA